jgi:hypothetical protein
VARKRCWLAQFTDAPCDGKLRKCHLIPKQLIRREVGLIDVYDERTWVWGCGGITGCSGHHGALDVARTLRIPRDKIPAKVEAFAEEHGLGWWLDREYGEAP